MRRPRSRAVLTGAGVVRSVEPPFGDALWFGHRGGDDGVHGHPVQVPGSGTGAGGAVGGGDGVAVGFGGPAELAVFRGDRGQDVGVGFACGSAFEDEVPFGQARAEGAARVGEQVAGLLGLGAGGEEDRSLVPDVADRGRVRAAVGADGAQEPGASRARLDGGDRGLDPVPIQGRGAVQGVEVLRSQGRELGDDGSSCLKCPKRPRCSLAVPAGRATRGSRGPGSPGRCGKRRRRGRRPVSAARRRGSRGRAGLGAVSAAACVRDTPQQLPPGRGRADPAREPGAPAGATPPGHRPRRRPDFLVRVTAVVTSVLRPPRRDRC